MRFAMAGEGLIDIGQAKRGKACGCYCIICRGPVVAKKGEIRRHHFAHLSKCSTCNPNGESLLHAAGKQIILEAGGVTVPSWHEETDPVWLKLTEACNEVEVQSLSHRMRFDVLGDHGYSQIAVEIKVSHATGNLKVDRASYLGIRCLEIDLSCYDRSQFNLEIVRNAVLHELSIRKWLLNESERAEADLDIRFRHAVSVDIMGSNFAIMHVGGGQCEVRISKITAKSSRFAMELLRNHSGQVLAGKPHVRFPASEQQSLFRSLRIAARVRADALSDS